MSINACSINEHTINTLCGRRRRLIIDSLLPKTGGGQQQHVHPDTAVPLNIFRRDNAREETVVDFNTLELPFVQVTIEINGQVHSQTIERHTDKPLVTVYGLSSETIDEDVTVFDFSVKILNEDVIKEHVNISDITLRIL